MYGADANQQQQVHDGYYQQNGYDYQQQSYPQQQQQPQQQQLNQPQLLQHQHQHLNQQPQHLNQQPQHLNQHPQHLNQHHHPGPLVPPPVPSEALPVPTAHVGLPPPTITTYSYPSSSSTEQYRPDYAPYLIKNDVSNGSSNFVSLTQPHSFPSSASASEPQTQTHSSIGQLPLDVKTLQKMPQNSKCADCGKSNPDWASMNLGIFLCMECAGIHRSLGVEYSKVRSINLDTDCWTEEIVRQMGCIGNDKSNIIYEDKLPQFYLKPQINDDSTNTLVRENWIRAKYERKEFKANPQSEQKGPAPDGCTFLMPENITEGWLTKQSGQRKGKWQKRWFVLHRRFLLYFHHPRNHTAIGKIPISGATIDLCDNCEQSEKLTFSIETPQRKYFVFAENTHSLFNWIHTLRRASVFYSHPSLDRGHNRAASIQVLDQLSSEMMQNAIHSGYLVKQGFDRKSWKRRWACLLGDVLYYFRGVGTQSDWKTLKDQKPRGAIRLTGANVTAKGTAKKGRKYCFCIFTEERTYFLCAESEEKMKEWVTAVRRVIDRCNHRCWVDFKSISLVP